MGNSFTDKPELPAKRSALDGEIPPYAFDPEDDWTKTFQKGLQEAGLKGKTVYEVGVGTGVNIAYMLQECQAARAIASDVDPRLITLAKEVVARLVPDGSSRFLTVPGAVSLLESEAARSYARMADVIVGCLPQVGDPADARFRAFLQTVMPDAVPSRGETAPDHFAHYYPWGCFDRYPFNVVGLGLNEALLRQARSTAPHADVVLNFGGRIGRDAIRDLFRANGYVPDVVHATIVRQSASTDITFHVALETALRDTAMEHLFTCEFFADPEGTRRLTALEASQRLRETPYAPLYHSILVVRGRPRH